MRKSKSTFSCNANHVYSTTGDILVAIRQTAGKRAINVSDVHRDAVNINVMIMAISGQIELHYNGHRPDARHTVNSVVLGGSSINAIDTGPS